MDQHDSTELPQFATVMRGYDRGQVDDYVSRLNDFLSDAERRAERAERSVTESGRRIERLSDELRQALDRPTVPSQPYEGLGERIESILRLAAEEADAIRRKAQDDAEEQLAVARRQRQQEVEAAERELAKVAERRDGVVAELRRVQDVLATLGLRAATPLDDDTYPQDAPRPMVAQPPAGQQAEESDETVVVDLRQVQAAIEAR